MNIKSWVVVGTLEQSRKEHGVSRGIRLRFYSINCPAYVTSQYLTDSIYESAQKEIGKNALLLDTIFIKLPLTRSSI
ncbi:hypothetical protein QLX08_011195 [Tetragonisca angustula]|uniref:Uncharacterized protein n=1 Tax=Tetragonisca angustula TaxID=166442 RepID=A0AAW0Z9B4_9HYME